MITKIFLCNWTPPETRMTLESIVGINPLIFPLPFEASEKITVLCFKRKRERKEKESGTMTYIEVIKYLK